MDTHPFLLQRPYLPVRVDYQKYSTVLSMWVSTSIHHVDRARAEDFVRILSSKPTFRNFTITESQESPMWKQFKSWSEVLQHVLANKSIAYKAPLDFTPMFVRCKEVPGNKIRVDPQNRDADPFSVDEGHLDRFWYWGAK